MIRLANNQMIIIISRLNPMIANDEIGELWYPFAFGRKHSVLPTVRSGAPDVLAGPLPFQQEQL